MICHVMTGQVMSSARRFRCDRASGTFLIWPMVKSDPSPLSLTQPSAVATLTSILDECRREAPNGRGESSAADRSPGPPGSLPHGREGS